MTTTARENIICAVCGNPSEHYVFMSTSTFGPCDLDLRPAPMRRNTMNMWIQECPHCGYVAGSLAQPPGFDKDWLKSEEYISCSGRMFSSRLAKQFYRRYLLNLKENNGKNAFYSTVHTAWACDDAGDKENAVYCRTLAVAALEKLIEKEPGNETYLVQKADLMRRAEMFEEVIAEYGDKTLSDDLLNRIITFQIEKAKEKNAGTYTVGDVMND